MPHITLKNASNGSAVWYAYLDVPPDVRAVVGRRRFSQTTGEHCKRKAQLVANELVVGWQRWIAAARAYATGEAPSDGARLVSAPFGSGFVLDHGTPKLPSPAEHAEDISFLTGREFGDVLRDVTPFDAHVDEWAKLLKASTARKYRAAVEAFAAEFATVGAVEPAAVNRWFYRLAMSGAAHATLKLRKAGLVSYATHLRNIGGADLLAVFQAVDLRKLGAEAAERHPFEPAEVVALHAAAEGDLADLIALAMYSGARIDELASLRAENVNGVSFKIADAKTKAGRREVPIHPAVAETVARLKADARGGLLFPAGGETLGRRFSNLKTAMGFGEDKTFHSIRKTVATMLRRAGVADDVRCDIQGWSRRGDEGLRSYIHATPLADKAAAIAKLAYPVAR